MRIRRWNRLPTQTRFTVIFICGLFIVLFSAIIGLSQLVICRLAPHNAAFESRGRVTTGTACYFYSVL